MGFSKYEAFLQVFPYTNPSIGHVPYLFLRLLENHQRFLKSGSYLPVAIFVEVPEEPRLLALHKILVMAVTTMNSGGLWGNILG